MLVPELAAAGCLTVKHVRLHVRTTVYLLALPLWNVQHEVQVASTLHVQDPVHAAGAGRVTDKERGREADSDAGARADGDLTSPGGVCKLHCIDWTQPMLFDRLVCTTDS
jgi:hypothetical protein